VNSFATFGTGCFWCTEACFNSLRGVLSVFPAYAGGNKVNPTYEQVCSGDTGYAEVIRIVFDHSIISYDELLEVFWFVHDPTQLNRQGNDIGSQYRSVIFYHNNEQKHKAIKYFKLLEKEKVWSSKIVTQIEEINNFYLAEDCHHDFFNQNQDNLYCQSIIRPKVENFKKVFSQILR